MNVNDASEWVQRWTHLARPGGRVLDVACGRGRHMAWFSSKGFDVTGIDRDAQALQHAREFGQVLAADIENALWPLLTDGKPGPFDVVLVTNYLWRPLLPVLLQSVAAGGLLLYETFAVGNASVGKPSRPDFLLQPGELLNICAGWTIVAYEDGFLNTPERFVQRIAAIAPAPSGADAGALISPPRNRLRSLE
ncbi:MAG: methyltransferase domain-containing protein [Rhodoferax sp.]|nr:methyltransferase domain-containing protein [Rhodoferax sp.]